MGKQRGPRKTPVTLVCRNCGEMFSRPPSQAHRKYCSIPCRNAHCRRVEPLPRVCPTCRKHFAVLPHEAAREYCSTKCANDRHGGEMRACATCGGEFRVERDRRERYCSRQCWRDGVAASVRLCEHCGGVRRRGLKRYCSPGCQQAASRRRVTVPCSTCGREFEVLFCNRRRRHHCSRQCYVTRRWQSREEDTVVGRIAVILGESAIRQQSFPWLVSSHGKAMHLDAYFPTAMLAVEYDGKMHRQFMPFYHRTRANFERGLARDAEKERAVRARGLHFLRIRDDEPHDDESLRLRVESALTPRLPLLRCS